MEKLVGTCYSHYSNTIFNQLFQFYSTRRKFRCLDRLREEAVKSKKDIIKEILTEIKGGYSLNLYWDYYQDTPGGKEIKKQKNTL